MEGCSSQSGDSIRSADYKCDCGLAPVIQTSFTYQNMGMRFRCCSKKIGQCPYFHFLPGDERIEGRARELLLILKDRESRNVKEKEKFQKENSELKLEKEKIIEENKDLMEENAKLLQENDQLKKQSGLMDRKIKHLEKKVKKVEMRSSRAIMISQVVCFAFFLILIVVIASFPMVRSIRY